MEAEERPTKIRKLGQSSDENENGHQSLAVPASTHPSHTPPPFKNSTPDASDDAGQNELRIPMDSDASARPPPADHSTALPAPQPPSASSPSNPQHTDATQSATPAKLSKNQLKKLRKKQEWEDGRDERKQIRRERMAEKRARKRSARAEQAVNGEAEAGEADAKGPSSAPPATGDIQGLTAKAKIARMPHDQLPITIIMDCGFDGLMTDGERISLGGQLTRCYSDNARARWRVHLVLSSLGGELKRRFDGLLQGHYRNWKGVRIFEAEEEKEEKEQEDKDGTEGRFWGDFVAAAEKASEWMKGPAGGKLGGALEPTSEAKTNGESKENQEKAEEQEGEVVYLSADSEETLTELKPYSTYIIGGLVDRNRHKGICAKRAAELGVRTARLPIGEYMQMNSRFVLATNHVHEIMLRWLECGDWGEAFLAVMPKRKRGTLKKDDGPGKDPEDKEVLESAENGMEREEADDDDDDVMEEDAIPAFAKHDESEEVQIAANGDDVHKDSQDEISQGKDDTAVDTVHEQQS